MYTITYTKRVYTCVRCEKTDEQTIEEGFSFDDPKGFGSNARVNLSDKHGDYIKGDLCDNCRNEFIDFLAAPKKGF